MTKEKTSETVATTEQLWNANYIKVMTTNFLLYFAFYLLTPLLPLYLSEEFGATKDVIGTVLSGYTVAALIVRPFCGYVVDSFSRKKVLMVCLTLFFVCFAGYIAAGTLLMFAICRTIHGAPFGAVTVANSTCAIDVLPAARRNEGIGLYGLSNNFAMAIAPSVGIWLHDGMGSYGALFWIALGVAGLSVVVASTVNLPEKEIIRNKSKISLDRFFLTRAWLLAINIAMFGFCWGALSNYLAIYSKEALGITGGTGTYFAILSTGLFLSRLQGQKSLREGKLTNNAAGRHVPLARGIYTFCRRATSRGLLSVGIDDRLGQRTPLPCLPQHVRGRGTARPARHGKLEHPHGMGPRIRIWLPARRCRGRALGLCGHILDGDR